MEAISVKLDGTTAAAPTVARKHAALFSALQYAVELELLPDNPLKQLKLRRPIVAEAVDRRVVVNHAQARALLTAVGNTYPALEAYFACLYYAALRPAEARHLRVKDCALPESGWGELILLGSTPDAGGAWTDSGQANEDRQLKHRGVRDTRPVPASPELVKILRQHIETFPTSPDGRLFRHPSRSRRRSAATALRKAAEHGHDLSSLGCGTCCRSHRYRVRLTAGQAPLRPAPRGSFALAECRRPADPGRRVGRAQRECPPQGLRQVRLWPRRGRAETHRGCVGTDDGCRRAAAAVTSSRIPHERP